MENKWADRSEERVGRQAVNPGPHGWVCACLPPWAGGLTPLLASLERRDLGRPKRKWPRSPRKAGESKHLGMTVPCREPSWGRV